jgi:hypothetical protein
VSVTWDTKNDCIYVTSDQTQLKPLLPIPQDGSIAPYVPEDHLVEYESIDVFGNKLSAQLKLYMPASSTEATKPLYERMLFKHEILPDPPWRSRLIEGMDLWISEQFGETEYLSNLPFEKLENYLLEAVSSRAGSYPYVRRFVSVLATAIKDGKAQLDSEGAQILLKLISG